MKFGFEIIDWYHCELSR